ncbi:ATP-binding domain-containing protein (plasmid) [Embleya sp. NBC_00888]|uniref:3'-5' exonuclease n=1 Tax=Embleya sp. NBC_00888 TaxID=2975960 RepID=UPI002F9130D0|nr:ATP-binding domain-containing protein [Embleya sp. NBC_00888]
MAELAGGRIPGRVTFTTYHSAKGREFSIVILPCLMGGVVPNYPDTQSPRALQAARHMFYVAVTRAQHEIVLLTGGHHFNRYGRRFTNGRTRFLDDMLQEPPSGPI